MTHLQGQINKAIALQGQLNTGAILQGQINIPIALRGQIGSIAILQGQLNAGILLRGDVDVFVPVIPGSGPFLGFSQASNSMYVGLVS
jgi:hypothetical protein